MSYKLKTVAASWIAGGALAIGATGVANAAYIQGDLSRVGGNTWDLSITADADPGQPIESFTVYFDWAQVSNLTVWGTPPDWDSIVVQGDSALQADGYYDALALATGITAPKALGGFIARFDWADAAGPHFLRYTVNDSVTFDVLDRGVVDLNTGGGSAPEPATFLLVAAGALARIARQLEKGNGLGVWRVCRNGRAKGGRK